MGIQADVKKEQYISALKNLIKEYQSKANAHETGDGVVREVQALMALQRALNLAKELL